MTLNEYQELMSRTYKPDRLLNHILGLCGEAGEIAELIKKKLYHEVPYTREKMKDELGDQLWYLSALAEDHGLALEEIAQHNIDKLRKRYPDGFVKGGGIRSESMSAQPLSAEPCGCDKGANWTCELHRTK